MNESRTIIELSDLELDHVTGGATFLPFPYLQKGNGDPNLNANSPNTQAADNGFNGHNGNGARIIFPI
jgi:hypothetical protein